MESNQGNSKILLFVLILCLVTYIAGSGASPIRDFISYIYSDTHYSLISSGENLKEYFGLYSDIATVRNENEELKSENTRLKSELERVALIFEKNAQYEKMKSLYIREEVFIPARMFILETLEVGFINKGGDDGVKEGAVVQQGEFYVGLIEEISRGNSLVKLPYSRSSFLKVSILKPFTIESDIERVLSKFVQSKAKSKGVMIGKGDKVVVENITMNKGVVDGDSIVITDEKVGKYLIVGYIKNIENDPASSSVSAEVELAIDYNDLNTYFISKNE